MLTKQQHQQHHADDKPEGDGEPAFHGSSRRFGPFDSLRDGIDGLQHLLGLLLIRHFEAVMLFEHHDELERIDGIETDAGGSEKGCLIADVGGFEIEHELGDEEFFEALACEHEAIGKGRAK
jgi:hypothetical protein